MIRAISQAVLSRRLLGWWIFLLGCGALAGMCRWTEALRHRDEIEFAKFNKLNRAVWLVEGIMTEDVGPTLLGKGKTIDIHPLDADVRAADVAGEKMGLEFKGWKLHLVFSETLSHGVREPETMISGHVIPPPGVVLRREPTALWWTVESIRAGVMIAGTVAWGTAVVLIMVVRRARRQVAPWGLAGSAVSLLAIGLAWNFQWEWAKLINPGWTNTAVMMGIVSLFLWVYPTRQSKPGGCHVCHYDLTGNVSGICPECGTPTLSHLRRQRLAEMAPAADQLLQVSFEPEIELPEIPADFYTDDSGENRDENTNFREPTLSL